MGIKRTFRPIAKFGHQVYVKIRVMILPCQCSPSLKTASFAWLLIWSSKYSKKVISIILQALQTVVACPVHAALKWRIIIRPKMHSFFLSVLRSCSKKFIYFEQATKIRKHLLIIIFTYQKSSPAGLVLEFEIWRLIW